jgi:hypothetical protein
MVFSGGRTEKLYVEKIDKKEVSWAHFSSVCKGTAFLNGEEFQPGVSRLWKTVIIAELDENCCG